MKAWSVGLAVAFGWAGLAGTWWLSTGHAQQVLTHEPVKKAQIEQWKKKLSNWGRWGANDERGALNKPDPQAVERQNGHARNSIINLKDGILTRGILIDIPRLKGVPYLEPGTPIYVELVEIPAPRLMALRSRAPCRWTCLAAGATASERHDLRWAAFLRTESCSNHRVEFSNRPRA